MDKTTFLTGFLLRQRFIRRHIADHLRGRFRQQSGRVFTGGKPEKAAHIIRAAFQKQPHKFLTEPFQIVADESVRVWGQRLAPFQLLVMEQLLPQLMKQCGATEQLKAGDMMKWVGLMNNIQAAAEEIVLKELVYR